MIRPSATAWLLIVLLGSGAAVAGTLEIRTQPGVDVYWEGVHLATTDAAGLLVVEDVPPGPFALTLSKEGFAELSEQVTIGGETTRFERRLEPLATSAVSESESEAVPAASEPARQPSAAPEVPTVRPSRGLWLLALLALGAAGALAYKLRRRPGSPPPPEPEKRRSPRVTRTPPEPQAGGGFLSELRQRERALDDLVDVSSGERQASVPEPDVVDVAWKEID